MNRDEIKTALLLLRFTVGFFTWPLCFLATLVISSITASNAAARANGTANR